MKRETFLRSAMFAAFIGFVFCFGILMAQAQTTVFTYQGKLSDGATAASGSYDLGFALYDAATGGNQIEAAITRPTVNVSNGIFTVQLDFGANAFPGAARYLEIAVKRPADTNFTTLTPRQQVTSTPYAIRAASSATADAATNASNLGGTAANQFVQTNDSRLSNARPPTAGSANYIQNTTTQQTSSNFNISGTGAANIFNATTQYNIDGNRVLSNPGISNLFAGVNAGTANTGIFNLFVGAGAGQSNTTGGGNSFVGGSTGQSNTTGGGNSFVGAGAGNANTTGGNNAFVGVNAGLSNRTGSNNTSIGESANVGANNLTYATAVGSGAIVSTSNTVVLGRTSDTVIAPNRLQVNALGAAGSTQLCRNASNQISTCSSSLRYKTNIASFGFGLNIVKQLRPISFDWKDGGMKDVGFGAEDVARINPLFVSFNAKGEVEGVKYDRLSVAFVNAFREQQTQIENQQKQIETQAAQNEAKQNQLDALREQVKQQQSVIDGLKKLVCAGNPNADVCRQP